MRPFEQAWRLLKGFRHKYGPVTHFHGVRGIEPENPNDKSNTGVLGRDPNRYRDTIESIFREGLVPSETHGAVFMAPLREAHGYTPGGPLLGIRTEGLDLKEGHMTDAHHTPHTIHEGTIDPERLTLISPNTFHENVNWKAVQNPSSPNYEEARNLPEGGLTDSYGRPRLGFDMEALNETI